MIFSKNLLAIASLAAASAFLPASLAEEFEYRVDPWGIPDAWSDGYPTLDAKAGDTVSFHWTSNYNTGEDYNVYLYPTESCSDEEGKEWIGSSSGAWYKINEWDQGKTLHFACDTADYCERGMSIVINVAAAPADAKETPEPTASPTKSPTAWPTAWPTKAPTRWPTTAPTYAPTYPPTDKPINDATNPPTEEEIINDVVAH